jgi:hypothetical protein
LGRNLTIRWTGQKPIFAQKGIAQEKGTKSKASYNQAITFSLHLFNSKCKDTKYN